MVRPMLVISALLVSACHNQAAMAKLQESILDRWWFLSGDDAEAYLYLASEEPEPPIGATWYRKGEPVEEPADNVDGGSWELTNGHTLHVDLSESLKKDLNSPADALRFDVQKDNDSAPCYKVSVYTTTVFTKYVGLACPYAGPWGK